jgi:hypothetical protein
MYGYDLFLIPKKLLGLKIPNFIIYEPYGRHEILLNHFRVLCVCARVYSLLQSRHIILSDH